MARTEVHNAQIKDGGVFRDDLNVLTTGQAVVTKLVQGTGISLVSTGVDAGTGDVTVSQGLIGANTVVSNPSLSAAVPSETALSLSQLVGRGSTGHVAAIDLGSGLSMSGTTLNATVTQYTDELAQDAVGAMVNSTLTYVDATPLLGINLENENEWIGYQTFDGGLGGAGSGLSDIPLSAQDNDAGFITSSTGLFVNNATNATLTRSGAGPYTLGINLGNANTWTAKQTFQLTTEQLRVGYDVSNYFTSTVSSTGFVTLDAVGSAAEFNFLDNLTLGNSTTGKTLRINAPDNSVASALEIRQRANQPYGFDFLLDEQVDGDGYLAAVSNSVKTTIMRMSRTTNFLALGPDAGSATPTAPVHIRTNASSVFPLTIEQTGSGSQAFINIKTVNHDGGFYFINASGNRWQLNNQGADSSNDLRFYNYGSSGSHLLLKAGGNTLMNPSFGNFAIGVSTPTGGKLEVRATTEQARLAYDASNYYSITVGSTGAVTLNATGAGAAFTYSDDVNFSTNLKLLTTASATVGNILQNSVRIFHSFGTNNLFLGAGAGNYTLTTASENTVIGRLAGAALTTGDNNIVVGDNAAPALTTGSGNAAIGKGSLVLLQTGTDNLFVGFDSGKAIVSTSYNTGMGASVLNTTTGTGNTGFGRAAGSSLAAGNYNVFIGYNAGNNASQLTTATNSIAIGESTFTTASNTVILGNSSITNTTLRGIVNVPTGTTSKTATVGGKIKEFFTSVGNVTTGEDDLYTYTTEANILGTNGEELTGSFGIKVLTSAGTATRQIKLWFGGTAIFDTTALLYGGTSDVLLTYSIIRVSATVVRYRVSLTMQGTTSAVTVGELTGLTLSNTNILKLTGEAAGAGAATNDIVAHNGDVFWWPVSV